jgi:3-phenylpropionate/trans-cinnamate dioxygenase ferredoxin subunit
MNGFVTVANAADLKSGELTCVKIGRKRVALANVDGEFFAFDDTCTHEEASLSEGELFGDTVECPLHGAAFNVRSGAVESFPATQPVATYPVRVVDGQVQVAPTPVEP